MKKTKDLQHNLRNEVFKTIGSRKLELIGILMFVILWIVGFILYDTNVFQLLMIIFSVLFACFYFVQSIIKETQLNIAWETLQDKEGFAELVKQVEEMRKEQKEE